MDLHDPIAEAPFTFGVWKYLLNVWIDVQVNWCM